ncbi:MAG: hypothetical protein FJW37_05530 [Acidobacteria bacterium]|nr:hypothetical protein [Acidobacteriota bacterium]
MKQEAEGRRLVFTREGKPVATVKGTVHQGDAFDLPATIPLVGTHFLRSSADPLATGQERQFSKTGLPQYMEETRQWRASLRVYRSADSREAWFLFYEVQPRPKRVDFRLSLAQP